MHVYLLQTTVPVRVVQLGRYHLTAGETALEFEFGPHLQFLHRSSAALDALSVPCGPQKGSSLLPWHPVDDEDDSGLVAGW